MRNDENLIPYHLPNLIKCCNVVSSAHHLTNRTDNTIFNILKESFCIRPTASKSIAIEHIHYLKEIQKCMKIK